MSKKWEMVVRAFRSSFQKDKRRYVWEHFRCLAEPLLVQHS